MRLHGLSRRGFTAGSYLITLGTTAATRIARVERHIFAKSKRKRRFLFSLQSFHTLFRDTRCLYSCAKLSSAGESSESMCLDRDVCAMQCLLNRRLDDLITLSIDDNRNPSRNRGTLSNNGDIF